MRSVISSAFNRDGQSRQMAFVGFRTAEEAAAAQKYFDHTFIDTSRLAVEVGA
jgi:multiple RNA-binding domain-containing protein 1